MFIIGQDVLFTDLDGSIIPAKVVGLPNDVIRLAHVGMCSGCDRYVDADCIGIEYMGVDRNSIFAGDKIVLHRHQTMKGDVKPV